MDPITSTILAALTAGVTRIAADAPAEIGKMAIKDAYEALKTALRNKFGGESKLARAVSELEEEYDYKPNQQNMAGRIEQVNATADDDLLKLMRDLANALAKTPEGRAGMAKFNVVTKDSQVGIVGNNAHVEGGIHSHKTEFNIETVVMGAGKKTDMRHRHSGRPTSGGF